MEEGRQEEKRLRILEETLKDFKEKVKGWMSTAAGEDFCPKCQGVGKKLVPTPTIAYERRKLSGWVAICSGCQQSILVPIPPEFN